jgi:hypothetical protein
MTEAQNWTLAQQNGINSVPASTDIPRHIKGDDPSIAGSSLVKMNEEMRSNGVQSSQKQAQVYTQTYTETHNTQTHHKTGMEKTLEQNQNIDAFERTRSDASEVSKDARWGAAAATPPARFERMDEVRESGRLSQWNGTATSPIHFEKTGEARDSLRSGQSYQKPRIANVQISQSKHYESSERAKGPKDRVFFPERNNSTRTTQTTVYNQYNQPYNIPKEDYSDPGIVMYNEVEKTSWKESRSNAELNRLPNDGKVKNLAGRFETTETTTSQTVASPSRNAVANEIKESLEERRYKRKSADIGDYSAPMSPRRTSKDYTQGYQDPPSYPATGGHPSTNWQAKSGKGTIETRVNRIKKVGAVSVFPD